MIFLLVLLLVFLQYTAALVWSVDGIQTPTHLNRNDDGYGWKDSNNS